MSDYYSNKPVSPVPARSNTNPPDPRGWDQTYAYEQPQHVNFWLRMTSAVARLPQQTLAQREGLRRNRLTSWIILGMFVLVCLLIPAGIAAPSTGVALGVAGAGLVVAALLNHAGWTTAAGVFLVVLIDAGIFGALAGGSGGLEVVDLPAYDLLAISVVVGASILPRVAAFVIAFCNCGLIVVSFLLLPKAPDLLQQITALGDPSLVARPIALQVVLAIVAYLWVRGVDEQVRRADSAEAMAALQRAYAEQRRQLEFGVQQILATHVRIANGDFSARAPLSQDNVLWQIAASLNNLLGRLQKAGQADYRLQRTDEEIDRLVAAMRDLQSGRQPIWPAPAGTSADKLLVMLAPPRLRQAGQANPLGQRSPWEGSVGPMSGQQQQQWPAGPFAGGQGVPGGVEPPPSPGRSREWSEPPAWFGAGYGNPVPPDGPFDQSPMGQPPIPSMPDSSNQAYWDNTPGGTGAPGRRPSSLPSQPNASGFPGFADGWPSLDLGERGGQGGQRSQADEGGADRGGDPFPPFDNPWYLPPDE